MKKYITWFFVTFTAVAAAQYFFAWWILAVVTGVFAFLQNKNAWSSLLTGGLVGALLWGLLAEFLNFRNSGVLSNSIGTMIGGLSGVHILLITIALAFIVGGMGAMTGALLRQFFTASPTIRKR